MVWYVKPTQIEWIEKIKPILNPQIWIAWYYEHSQKPVMVGCYDCNRIFPMQVHSVQRGKGCRQCNHRRHFDQVIQDGIQAKKDRAQRNEHRQKHCLYPPKPYWMYLETHLHHIIPKHIGGSDNPDNLVELLAIDHAIAHYVRFKMYKTKMDLYAYQHLMGRIGLPSAGFLKGDLNPMKDPAIKAYHAQRVRELAGVTACRGDKNGMRKKKLAGLTTPISDEHKKAISLKLKGSKKSEEFKQKLRARTGSTHHLSHAVSVNHVVYGSMREAARVLQVDNCTIANWIKNGKNNAKRL